jgi:hypothetical protein
MDFSVNGNTENNYLAKTKIKKTIIHWMGKRQHQKYGV